MKKHRGLAALLAAAVAASMLTVPALAADFADIEGHWGASSIERWADYGVVQGSDGKFNPDAEMTRAELAAVMARLLGLRDKAENTFADVDEGAWYADAILKCAAAGILKGDGTGANPNGTVTRQEAAVMLGRALGIQPAQGAVSFADGSEVAGWAAGYVKAMAEKGIINGVGGNAFAPLSDINRASVTTILDKSISTYANEKGASVEAAGDGLTVVAAPDVTVTGAAADIVVAPGAADGTTTLENTAVTGTVTVSAPQAEVVLAGTTKAADIVVSQTAEAAKVTVASTAEAQTITAEAPKAEVAVAGKVDKVETAETADSAKVTVEKSATVSEVAVGAAKTEVAVSGKVDSVQVNEAAADTKVQANSGATISKVDNAAAGTTVSGSGKVENVTTSGDNTKVDTSGTKVEAAEGTTGTTAGGTKVDGGESTTTTKPSTGGGGGGGSSGPSYTTVNDAAALATAFQNGGYVRLGTDIAPADYLTIPAGKNVTLDLNGKILTMAATDNQPDSYRNICVYGTLTIEDRANGGKIVRSAQTSVGALSVVEIDNGGKIVMNSGMIEAGNPSNADNTNGATAVGVFNDSTFEMNGGSITASWYAVCSNGTTDSNAETYGNNARIVINGGQLISSTDYAVYAPSDGGVTTISDGHLQGSWGAVQLTRGELNVKGGTLTCNGAANAVKPDGQHDGSTPSSAAAISLNAVHGPITASLSGGTFSTTNGEMAVKKSGSHNVTTNITGGTYSSDVTELCATGYACEEVNGKYVVKQFDDILTEKLDAFASDLSGNSLPVTMEKAADKEYNVTFTSATISGTNAVAMLSTIPGLTKVSVAKDGATTVSLEVKNAESGGAQFKTDVTNLLPTASGSTVDLTVTFSQGESHTAAITLHVTNNVTSDSTTTQQSDEGGGTVGDSTIQQPGDEGTITE
ncbi:MAG: S-layer homology domain-containing protein [Eubacteriales bacterium]|nr:S-layer homology domain-containing protein [Eubacteriales bacterium]